jgi:peroxiredoxin
MLKYCHPFTLLATALVIVGSLWSWSMDGPVGPVLLFLAHGCVLLEFKKYTSRFQFILVMVSAVALGLALDTRFGLFPAITIALALCGLATNLRQMYMPVFTYVNYLWLEPALLVIAGGLLADASFGAPFQWEVGLLPLLPFGAAASLSFGYVQDGRLLRKKAGYGYRVQIGQPAPDLELLDQVGLPVRLSDHRGKYPVLLIFVRGDWCPGCHMMLRTYEQNRMRFLERGVHVLAIGPDNVKVNQDMVQRIGVGYRLLSDPKQRISRQYGVVYNNPIIELGVNYEEGIPLPASFLVDANGIVRYVSRPDRVGEFLDPTLIFGVLDQLPGTPDAPRKAA